MDSTMPGQTLTDVQPSNDSTEAEVGNETRFMAMTVNLLEVPAREEQSAMHVRREKMSEDAPEEVAGERMSEAGNALREAVQSERLAEGAEKKRPEAEEHRQLLEGGLRGEKVAEMLCRRCDLRNLGLALSWMIFEGGRSQLGRSWLWGKVAAMNEQVCCGQLLGNRSLFPFPHVWRRLERKLKGTLIEDIFMDSFWTSDDFVDGWVLASVKFCQHLHGGSLGFGVGSARKFHWAAIRSIDRRVREMIDEWKPGLVWGPEQIKEDLSKRDIGYAGEEVGKVEKLSRAQILPSLPPPGRGGSVRLIDWVGPSTRRLLENPSLCEIEDCGQQVPRLTGRVHIQEGEKLEVARLLVERGICKWYPEKEVFRFRGTSVKNGMFGVVKPGKVIEGRETLRVIMNLIPSNSIHSIIPGAVHRLPTITQWTSIFLGPGERVEVSQADITSAFYLFELPIAWHRRLAFNIDAIGSELGPGYDPEIKYSLCACVLPMGWNSAVGVMEEAAENLLKDIGLQTVQSINRVQLLPAGFVEKMKAVEVQSTPFWHIYLDNYASGQRVQGKLEETLGGELHNLAETGRGILTAPQKSVHRALVTTELGAYVQGERGWIGASPERLEKTIKLSLWLATRGNMRRKTLQIAAGRWMHVLQFRRPAMSHFSGIWEFLQAMQKKKEWKARWELLCMSFGAMLVHSDLKAPPSARVTASDASSLAGAVGVSEEVTPLGKDFLFVDMNPSAQGMTIPILVISLFDGIGGAMRSYNVAGARPAKYVSIEIHSPAKRVVSRRWPEAIQFDDVNAVDATLIREWIGQAGPIRGIHLWGGFPCKDLSAAKAGRRNLEGDHSSLFYQLKRIWKEVHSISPELETTLFAENVCSMDVSARDTITAELGFAPYRVDSDHVVCLSRPRFVWTNLTVREDEHVWTEWKNGFWQVYFSCERLQGLAWTDPGWTPFDETAVFPTCMRAIARWQPPPRPVGYARCLAHELSRWRQDAFRFPPYQYKDCYMMVEESSGKTRYISVEERERLMGYGTGHTEFAWNASAIKGSPRGYTDERLSLLGDAFPVNTFWLFAASSIEAWIDRRKPEQYLQRLGLFPGSCSHVDRVSPFGTQFPFGSTEKDLEGVEEAEELLVRQLARRVAHNGSDIRVSLSVPTNPRLFSRQSIPANFWKWTICWKKHWEVKEHINALEMRSILLSLQWRLQHQDGTNLRVLHLTDSSVCLSILAKGRTSSKALSYIVRKINSLALMCNIYMLGIHVDSIHNPTDAASRQ